METTAICTVTPVERQRRKLIYLPSRAATGYFDYCEEMGCEWEGLLNSIPERFDAALHELPDFLRMDGENKIASGFEMPPDYEKPLPDGYRVAERGYRSADQIAPAFNLGAEPRIGARIAIPAIKK